MAEDERASVVVEAFNRNTHLTCKVDVVDSERVMRFNRFDVRQADTCCIERITCGRNCCLRHEALLCTSLPESQHLYFNCTVTAEFSGSLSRCYYHAAVPIRGVRLRAEADCTALLHRTQPLQPLCRGGEDAFVVCHRCYYFTTGKIFHLKRC